MTIKKNTKNLYLIINAEKFNVNYVASTRDEARFCKKPFEKIIQVKKVGNRFETRFIR